MNTSNNFDFLRLLFSLFVIVTHSYSLSGLPEEDALFHITNGQLIFSYTGVCGFFIISGFLVFRSLENSKDLFDFFKRRVFRIFPALFVVLVLSAFVLGPLLCNKVDYFSDPSVWRYVPTHLQLIIGYNNDAINGVFENNPSTPTINGSLWTISYEFLFYAALSVLILIRNKKTALKIILSAFYIFLFAVMLFSKVSLDQIYIPKTNFSFLNLDQFGLFFTAGAVLAVFDFDKFNYRHQSIIVSLLLIAVSMYFHFFYLVQHILLPLLIISFGTLSFKFISEIKNRAGGDYSYGTYLWGYVVLQTIIYLFHPSRIVLMLIAVPVSIGFGILSWHLVEKPALRLKEN